jgi:hypothetical protein
MAKAYRKEMRRETPLAKKARRKIFQPAEKTGEGHAWNGRRCTRSGNGRRISVIGARKNIGRIDTL